MELRIYIDRLKEGEVEKLSGTISTTFLDVQEEDLSFHSSLSLKGEAYLTADHLILRLTAQTSAYLPCTICNSRVEWPISIDSFYHAEPLSSISSVFDYSELLREDILLELPQFAECQGNCPERERMKTYLKKDSSASPAKQYPFANLEKI